MTVLERLWMEEEGADSVEYALVASLILTAILVGMTTFAGSVSNLFSFVANRVDASIPLL